MKHVIDRSVWPKCNEYFGPWLAERLGTKWFPGRGETISLWDDRTQEPLAVCLFEAGNGAMIMLHIATDGSAKWMNREYLWFVFHYPFDQLRVTKIIAPVESTNTRCSAFVEHIGFTLEATLKDCAPNGDMLIYSMRRDQCKWLNLEGRYRGETKRTTAS